MPPKRGRPIVIDSTLIKEIILKHSQDVIGPDGKVASVKAEIWQKISDQIPDKPKVSVLYSFVCCDRYNVRKELMNKNGLSTVESDINDSINSTLDSSKNSLNDSSFLSDGEEKKFMISVLKEEWLKLITVQQYKQKIRNKVSHRERRCLTPGKWTSFITNLVWTNSKMKCGFNFRNHYVPGGNAGYINGKCNCSNELYIQIDERDNKNVILHCIITVKESSQQCKKTYLREPTRKKYAAEAATKSVEALRAEIAYKLMEVGDPEPPHLPKSNVLHVAIDK